MTEVPRFQEQLPSSDNSYPRAMKNRFVYIVCLMCMLPFVGRAQQDFLAGQTFVNPALVNPSLAAFNDNWELGVMVRNQWIGHENSPSTQILSLSGTVGKPRSRRASSGRIRLNRETDFAGNKRLFHGLSFNLINDVVGAFGRMDAQLHWSPMVRLGRKVYAGVGPTLRYSRFQVNPERVDFLIANDQAWTNIQSTSLTNDAIGINVDGVIFTPRAYLGVSLLDPLKASWIDDRGSQLLVDRGLQVTGGYNLRMNARWDLDAVLTNRYVQGAPLALDATARMVYQDAVWLGAGYRATAAVSFTVGALLANRFRCSYAVERSTLSVSGQLGWSHEFYLSYVFPARSDLNF